MRHILDLRFKHVAFKDSYSLRIICPRPRLFRPVIASDRTAKVVISCIFFLTPILDRLVHFFAKFMHIMLVLLQERRSALISAAVTGQIDVRGLVTEQEVA